MFGGHTEGLLLTGCGESTLQKVGDSTADFVTKQNNFFQHFKFAFTDLMIFLSFLFS